MDVEPLCNKIAFT